MNHGYEPPPCCECGKPAEVTGIHCEGGPSHYCTPCTWVPIRDGELKRVRKLPRLPQEGGAE